MRRLLTDEEVSRERVFLRWNCLSPIIIATFVLFIIFTGDLYAKIAYSVPVCVHSVNLAYCINLIIRYRARLKGAKRIEFLELYHQLHDYSADDDLMGVVVTIREMSDIIEGDFKTVRKYVFQNAGRFLPHGFLPSPLRLFSLEICYDALRVLEADLELLPKFLSHKDARFREVASHRLRELTEGTYEPYTI